MQWNEAFPFEFQKKSMETETTTWSGFSNCGKATVGQILVSEEIYKSNTAGLWIWVNHLSKVTLERKIITKVQQVHQFHWNVSKWESLGHDTGSLFYRLDTCFQKNFHLDCIAGRPNIFCKYLIFLFFKLWVWFLRLFFHVIFRSSSFAIGQTVF